MKPFRLLLLLAAVASLILGTAQASESSEISQLLREGKLAEAQARVDRQLAARPKDPQLRLFKGVIQRESGRLNEALATFSKLSADHPELPEPYNNLAVILAAQGQYDQARQALEKALRTHPSYATAHDNLADVYARLASQAYSKALQLESSQTPASVRLALIRDLPAPAGWASRPVLAAITPPSTSQAAPAAVLAKPAATPTAQAPGVATATDKPAAPAPAAAPASSRAAPPAAPPATGPRDVEQAVQAWAQAWSARDMSRYLAAYAPDFDTPGTQTRAAWEEERRVRIVGKSHITVKLMDIQITVTGNRAVAKFRQDYKADTLAVLSRKTLELARTGDRWLIVKENSGS